MWFRESLMADEETMSYNHAWGGTIPFPKERWKGFYEEYRTEEKIVIKKKIF
jgi:diamine N-acetyltransferase